MDSTYSHNVFGLCSYRWAIFAAVLCLTLALTEPAHAKTVHCGAGDVACLIAAINQANANGHKDTIRLEPGVYMLNAVNNDTNGPNGLPAITNSLTIQGTGSSTTFITRQSSAPRFRFIDVTASGNLTLDGITLSGGNGGFEGGGSALFNDGGTTYIVRSSITGNGSSADGAVYNQGGAITVTDSIFANNSSLTTGGLASTAGTVNITGSRFTGNLGTFLPGALSLYGGTASITKSTFDHNLSNFVGAIGLCDNSGFCTDGIRATLTITDSAFTDNPFSHIGAIAISASSTATIINTTFARNGAEILDTALAIWNQGTLHLDHVTLAHHNGGTPTLVAVTGATTTIENSILALTTNRSNQDCSGVITSLGNNLIGNPAGCNISLQRSDLVGDPGLDVFQDNGQPGNGHYPLLPSSRAIDAGGSPCPKFDQIGQRRIGTCDIGAIAFHD